VPLPDLPELRRPRFNLREAIIQQIAQEDLDPEKYQDDVQERMAS